MTVSIKIQGRYTSGNLSYIDFYIFVDGVCDDNIYRQTNRDDKFSKLLSFNRKNWNKAIRGKKREIAQNLINQIINTTANFAIAII